MAYVEAYEHPTSENHVYFHRFFANDSRRDQMKCNMESKVMYQ